MASHLFDDSENQLAAEAGWLGAFACLFASVFVSVIFRSFPMNRRKLIVHWFAKLMDTIDKELQTK